LFDVFNAEALSETASTSWWQYDDRFKIYKQPPPPRGNMMTGSIYINSLHLLVAI